MRIKKALSGIMSIILAVTACVMPVGRAPELNVIAESANMYTENNPCTDTSGKCGENVTWTLDSEGVLTISGTGEMTDFIRYYQVIYSETTSPFGFRKDIKSVVIENGVTSIGNNTFLWCGSITSVTIPNSVANIGSYTFDHCTSLEDIALPNSVTSIGNGAFYECTSLKDITLPNSITSISNSTFYHCASLKEITIPNSVTGFEGSVFSNCFSLEKITIPDSVTVISGCAFCKCTSLKSITILNPECKIYSRFDTISTSDSGFDGTIYGYKNSPAQTYAEKYSYKFEVIDEPPSADIIDSGKCGDNAKWTLDSEGVLTISGTGKMTNFTSSNTPFGGKNDIKSVVIQDGITNIGTNTFLKCASLKNVTIPDSVTVIDASAFEKCASLDNVKIPNSVTSIASQAFIGCTSLTEITIPDKVTSIGNSAFSGCTSLKTVTIPDSVTKIENAAFSECTSLENITIPESVTTLGKSVFYCCDKLTDVTVPKSVTNINYRAFGYCAGLKKITILNTECKIDDKSQTICNYKDTNYDYFEGTIYGYTGSTAQAYAEKYGFEFESLGKYPFSWDDITIGNNWEMIYENKTGEHLGAWMTLLIDNGTKYLNGDYDFVMVMDAEQEPAVVVQTKTLIGGTDSDGNPATGWYYASSDSSKSRPYVYYYKYDDIAAAVTSTGIDSMSAATKLYISARMSEATAYGLYAVPVKSSAPVTTKPVTTTTTKATTTTVKPTTTTAKKTTASTAKTTTTAKPSSTSTTSATTALPAITNSFKWGRDNWNFKNNTQYFKRGIYYLDDAYYSKLMKNMSEKEWEGARSIINNNWGGSCYGMSATTLLAGRNLLTYGLYTSGADCLNKLQSPAENVGVESLINYYQTLQVKDCIQQQYRSIPYRSNETNIKDIIEKLKTNSMVLLGYQQKSFGGHSVVAYGVTYASWKKNNITYNGRIEIIDPNCSMEYDENACIYFNTKTYDWAIPKYNNVTTANSKKAVFNMILTDTDIINNGGYLGGVSMNFAGDYMASLEVDSSSEESVIKVLQTANGVFVNQSSDNAEDILPASFFFLGDGSEEVTGYILRDAESAYRTSLGSPDAMKLKIDYENCCMEAQGAFCDDIIFDPSGYASIAGAGTDYSLSMVCNKGFYPTDWYKIAVSGENADKVSLEKIKDGYIMRGNNLSNVNIETNNYTVNAKRQFSTNQNSVYIYEIDEETIGIRADLDNDGVYESELGEVPSNSDKTQVPDDVKATVYGDTNLDGAVNIADVVQLNKFLLNKKDNPIEGTSLANADCMKDGFIDSSDSTFLMNYVSMQITADKLGVK